MATKQFFLIGISGATNSGKSSIASKLTKCLPNCTWMCQDHYFLAEDDPRVELAPNGMKNYEMLSALDMDTMLSDVFRWIDQHKSQTTPTSLAFLVIEGFMIFNHRPLANLCDKKFFIQVDKETSHDRRKCRDYDGYDLGPNYFPDIVWPMYLKNLKDLEDQKDIEYVDGLYELDDLFKQFYNSIESKFLTPS